MTIGQDHCYLTGIVTKAPEPNSSVYFLQRVTFETHVNSGQNRTRKLNLAS